MQHLEANLAQHFFLLKEERENILWKGSEAVSFFRRYIGKLFKRVALVNYIREVISLTLATETKLTNQTKQEQ